MRPLNGFDNSVYSIFSYFFSRSYDPTNYVTCTCGTCVNCHKHDGSAYHYRYRASDPHTLCAKTRRCMHCNRVKNTLSHCDGRYSWNQIDYQDDDSYSFKDAMIDVYILLFNVLMIPLNLMCGIFYAIHDVIQTALIMLYEPAVLSLRNYYDNNERDSYPYRRNSDPYHLACGMKLDHREMLDLNILSKVVYMIRFFFVSTYETLVRNMYLSNTSTDKMLCAISLVGIGGIYGYITHTFTIFITILLVISSFVAFYDRMILIHTLECFSLIIIHIPRILLLTCICVSAHIAIMLDYFIVTVLINKYVYPFLKIDDTSIVQRELYDHYYDYDYYYNYRTEYAQENCTILSRDIDICHVFSRIIFLIPTFSYYLIKCTLNMLLLTITGKILKGTHDRGDLFELEKCIFYRNPDRGTVICQLCEHVNNTRIMIFGTISYLIRRFIKILYNIFIVTPWTILLRYFHQIMYIITHHLLIQYIKTTDSLHRTLIRFKLFLLKHMYNMGLIGAYYYGDQMNRNKQKYH